MRAVVRVPVRRVPIRRVRATDGVSVGLLDADLLGHGTTHPNLALMKLSAYYKRRGVPVRLMRDWERRDGEVVYVSKVFSDTVVPDFVWRSHHYMLGGTGFFDADAPMLPPEVEHQKPDYGVYEPYVQTLGSGKRDRTARSNFTEFSIGFLTRGCFRKCPYCVNRRYNRVVEASPLAEFLDDSKPYVRLWDDNILAFGGWREKLDELNELDKPFVFQQGLDVRLLTPEKAKALVASNYWHHDYIFAFDNIEDRAAVTRGLGLWASHANIRTKGYYAKVYVFCAYPEAIMSDVLATFERISILASMGYLPYVMRHQRWKRSSCRDWYVSLAAWCNMPYRFLKYSYRDFVMLFGERSLGRNVATRLREHLDRSVVPARLTDRCYADYR